MLRSDRIIVAVLGGVMTCFLAGCERSPAAPKAPTATSTSPQATPTATARPPAAATPIASESTKSPPPTASSTQPPAASQTPAPDGFVRVVNTHCPVQTDHAIRRGMVSQEYAVEHRGRMIGMCCGDCVDYWKNLTDEERDELVAKVMPPAPK